LDLVPVKEPLVDAFPCERQSSTNTQEHAKEAPTSLDSIQRELAARNSPYGIHGEISEYLTTKTLFREICPPKPSKQEATCTLHVPGPDLSCLDTDSVECVPVNPPSTPCLGFSGGSLTPVSECFTPDDSGSVFSDWEPIDDGKSFFETFVDLVPGESKTYTEDTENAFKRSSATAEELPKAVEGRSKPVTVRQPVGAVEPIAKVAPACFRINAVAPEGHVFYFAYDADLNAQRFSTLISRAVTDKRWGLLFGFQLIFNKQGLDAEAGTFANIEANPYSSTEGAVYTLSHNELILVDAHHGYPEHYVRMIVPVWMCNSSDPAQYNIAQYCIPAVAYIAQNTWTCTEQSLPASSKEYSLRQMLHGADQLSNGYKQHLESMLQECCC
ncbi:uncharacterized protein, partial [Watersipora subatra]|uniref:uncharacterized protein n=1 Tax=Watersipora subatra TaxID=2589382 RepID=UPI00355B8DDC